jgi:hypothetical protein
VTIKIISTVTAQAYLDLLADMHAWAPEQLFGYMLERDENGNWTETVVKDPKWISHIEGVSREHDLPVELWDSGRIGKALGAYVFQDSMLPRNQ